MNLSLPRTVKLRVPPMVGDDIDAHARAMHRYLHDGQLGEHARQRSLVRRTFGVGKRGLAKKCARRAGLPEHGVIGPALYAALRDAGAYDSKADQLIDAYNTTAQPALPDLGPVYHGGKTVLDHDLTHATDGIPFYPAFDDAFTRGLQIIAPEPLIVTRASSSRPGCAFYCTGQSGIRYWFGHLAADQPVGRQFARGAVIGRVGENHIGGGPHVHVGINIEALWGRGRELAHHTDYSHGAPTVGAQLRAHA